MTFRTLFFLALFLLFSCSSEDGDLLNPKIEPEEESTIVTYAEAVENLNDILDCIDAPDTRGSSSKRVVADYYTIGEPINTRSDSDEDSEPFLYIFNFENDEGFAIVSGDKRTTPIFAVTDSGSLNPGDVIDNPGLAGFLMNLEESWHDGGGGLFGGDDIWTDFKPPYDTTIVRHEYSDWKYEKIANPNASFVNWGQKEPYNNLAPMIMFGLDPSKRGRAPAGCVATAVAQLCAYYRYPSQYEAFSFNWSEMVKHMAWGVMTENTSAYDQIGRFFREISTGKNLDMDFGLKESSSKASRTPRTLDHLGYSQGGVHRLYQSKDVISELEAGYPVLISGMDKKMPIKILGITVGNNYTGHTWLADRLLVRSRTRTTYALQTGKVTTTPETESFIYCNWGWDGRDNGYFVSGVFNANHPFPEPDTRSGTEGNYQYKHRMVIGIRK